MLAGAIGGGFVERANKARIMVAIDLSRFAIVIATPVAWCFNLLSFPLLCVLAALAGARRALFQNGDGAILPRLVAKDHLVDTSAQLQVTGSLAELSGPGIAGVLIDLLTAPVAMIVDAFTFIWSALWLGRVPKGAGEAIEEAIIDPTPRQPMLLRMRDDVAVGCLASSRCRPMRAIIAATFLFYVSRGSSSRRSRFSCCVTCG